VPRGRAVETCFAPPPRRRKLCRPDEDDLRGGRENSMHPHREDQVTREESGHNREVIRRCPPHLLERLRRARDSEAQATRRGLLRGSRILVVVAGYPGEPVKRRYYERARALGVELVLLDGPWHAADGLL